MGGQEEMWEVIITFRRWYSPQGGVKDERKMCQLMESRDGHVGDVNVLGEA